MDIFEFRNVISISQYNSKKSVKTRKVYLLYYQPREYEMGEKYNEIGLSRSDL